MFPPKRCIVPAEAEQVDSVCRRWGHMMTSQFLRWWLTRFRSNFCRWELIKTCFIWSGCSSLRLHVYQHLIIWSCYSTSRWVGVQCCCFWGEPVVMYYVENMLVLNHREQFVAFTFCACFIFLFMFHGTALSADAVLSFYSLSEMLKTDIRCQVLTVVSQWLQQLQNSVTVWTGGQVQGGSVSHLNAFEKTKPSIQKRQRFTSLRSQKHMLLNALWCL